MFSDPSLHFLAAQGEIAKIKEEIDKGVLSTCMQGLTAGSCRVFLLGYNTDNCDSPKTCNNISTKIIFKFFVTQCYSVRRL